MIEDAVLVGLVIGVAADVRPAVDQQHPRAMLAGQPLGEHRAGKAGADDQIIVTAPGARRQGRGHSAATSSAGVAAPLRVPNSSAMRPAMRAWVVSQLVADSMRSASASQPLSGCATAQRFLARRDELVRCRGDHHAFELAVVAHDVA